MPVEILSIDFITSPPQITDGVVLILGRGKEGRSVTVTDEFRIASGYGSVMVLVNGLEPLPIRLQGDCSTIRAKPAYLAGQRGLEPR